ncbi:uncharacterized protein LOC126688223 isoform X2 [Mercurialis annua]|nr:uncharacterized protein LOC126688223 isoform X2 [Mercurialis annua]
MTKSLWYFEEFSMIYGKDRATGKDAQGVEDILEEIQVVEETGGGDNEVESEAHGTSEASVIGTNGKTDDASSKKQKSKGSSTESFTAESIMNAAILLSKEMKEIGKEISKSLGVELTIQEKAEQLFGVLNDIEGLTMIEKFAALRKIPKDPTQMLVFFSIPVEHKLLWVKEFLADTSF